MGEGQRPGPAELERGFVELQGLGQSEVLVEPLLVSWEGNCHHAVQRRPVDLCRVRNEPSVVIGNAGVVRVLKLGPDVTGLTEGDVCSVFASYRRDEFGYMVHGGVFGYDAGGTVGLLAKRTKLPADCLIRLPEGTRHSLAQWAAFGVRYVTAWSNWRVALGTWRLQVTEEDQPHPHVWGWGGGTTFAELTLAQRAGAKAAMIASHPARFNLAESHGLIPIDRRRFPHILYDEQKADVPEYEDRYRASEQTFLRAVRDVTGERGVSIFVDYLGSPVLRATLKSLARQGVVTTAGWREGMRTPLFRAIECIRRRQHVHTHFARRPEADAAMEYGERTGWMPPIGPDEKPWRYDDVPKMVAAYAANQIDSYFPLVEVNS